jgi:hypothetical protein
LLFTDGAVELPGPSGEEIGEGVLAETMRNLVAASEGRISLVEIEERLLVLSGCIRALDDLTLIKLRRSPKTAGV